MLLLMKKFSLTIFFVFFCCNVSLADLENKFLYCDVQKPDPDYFKPKNLVFKIDYKKQANLGTGYFYRLDGAEIPGWKDSPFGVQLVDNNIYHLYPKAKDAEAWGRVFDIFINLDEMKTYINLYEPGENINIKRFESNCKFVTY